MIIPTGTVKQDTVGYLFVTLCSSPACIVCVLIGKVWWLRKTPVVCSLTRVSVSSLKLKKNFGKQLQIKIYMLLCPSVKDCCQDEASIVILLTKIKMPDFPTLPPHPVLHRAYWWRIFWLACQLPVDVGRGLPQTMILLRHSSFLFKQM